MLKTNIHALIAVFVSVIAWLGERSISAKLGHESVTLFPRDGAEFGGLVLMVGFLILGGMFIDARQSLQRQQNTSGEVHRIYTAMVYAMHHILNNFLNGMELVRMEAVKCHDFDPHVLRLYDEASKLAVDQIRTLSTLEEISESRIMAHVAPGIRPLGD